MNSLVTRLFQRYARYASRKPLIPLVIILAVIGGALVLTGRIGLDASFEALLPADTPSVMARQEARRRAGASDLFLIAIRSPDPPANFRFAKALSKRMEQWPEADWVMDHIDLQVFRDKALLFMELDDLTTLVDLVELKVLRGQCEAQNNCNERDLRTDEERRADQRQLEELGERYNKRINDTAGDRTDLTKRHPGLDDALMSPDGRTAVVLAKLTKGTNNIEFARGMMLRGEELIAELDPTEFHPEMRAQVQGAYRSSNEYDTVLRDATRASLVSLTLVVLVMILFFRRLSAVLLVAGALVVGIIWTMGLTALTYPTLNTVTAVIFGILLGMGIDYAIHLCVAARAARKKTGDLGEALAVAVEETTPAMLTSALTTAAALLTLAAANNRGFREFGLIGAGGVLLCLCSAELVIPPIWGVLDRIKSDTKALPIPGDGWMARRGPLIAAILGIGLCALLAWRVPLLTFEYDLSNLGAPRADRSKRISYNAALRTGRGTTPAALLGENEEQLRLVHRFLTKQRDDGDERLRDIITIETFIPPDQEEKLEEIERLRSLLRPRTIRRVSKRHRADLEDLARLAGVEEPIAYRSLPGWAARTLRERDGTVGKIGFLYLKGRHTDARKSMGLQRDYGRIEVEGHPPVRVAASPFVIADVVYTMQADGKRMAILAVIAVLLLLIVDLRSIVGTLACFMALVLGLAWAFGAAELMGWKLGVFNMLVVPVALGLGIDGSIHVYHRFKRLGAGFAKSPLGATGLAVLASSVTTLAGFSGLLAVQHRGLESIGRLAVMSVAFTLVAVLGVLPGVLVLIARRRGDRDTPTSTD